MYAPTGPGAYPPPASTAFSFQSLLRRYQTVLTQPSVATFDAELPSANWQAVWIGLVILAVVEMVFGYITALEGRAANLPGPTLGSAIGTLIGTFIGFFLTVVILQLIARAFGGIAPFLTYTYVLSLVYVPIGVIQSVAGIVPVLGGLVGLAAFFYGVYLSVLATQSAQRVSQSKAWWIVLIPAIAAVVLFFLLVIVFGLALIAFGVFGH